MNYQKRLKQYQQKDEQKIWKNNFSILNGTKYFSPGIFQNRLVFTPATKYIKYFHGTAQIYSWSSRGMSEESIENITKSDSNFPVTLVDYHSLPDINFNGQCLIKDNISTPKKVITLYISYALGPQLRNFNTDFTLIDCSFESVKLTKNVDLDKHKYTGYGIGFGSHREYSLPDGSISKNAIIFGVVISSSVHFDNKQKDILR